VTHVECAKIVDGLREELKTMKVALVGEDMRGGLVKDVQEIKSATGFVKTVFLPIIMSVSAAVITYLAVNGISH